MNKYPVSSIFVLLLLFSSPLSGQDMYTISRKVDLTVWGVSAGLFGTSLIIEKNRDPITEEQIFNLNAEDVFGFDRSATDNFSSNAANVSDIFRDGIYLTPFTLFLAKDARSEFKDILFMYSEVIALNGALTKITKDGSGRFRPFAYNPDVDLELKLISSTRESFFSGHVSQVSSLAFFTASVFTDLYPDSNYKYLVWAGAITAPALTGYYRYKAGRHFPTDVIVGYGVGALIGYFIPKLHKRKTMADISIIGNGNEMGLLYQF